VDDDERANPYHPGRRGCEASGEKGSLPEGAEEETGAETQVQTSTTRSETMKLAPEFRPAEFNHNDFAPRGYHWDEETEEFVPDRRRKPLARWDGEKFADNEKK
jgi:hypothetical protein